MAKTSKYIRLYGMTLKQMSEKHGKDYQFYQRLHRLERLTEFLEDPEAFARKQSVTKYTKKYGMNTKQLAEHLGFKCANTVGVLERAGFLEPIIKLVENRRKLQEFRKR